MRTLFFLFAFPTLATGEADEALRDLLTIFPGLWPSHDVNEDKMVERQGDIIECMLAKASLTGDAICRLDRLDRNRFHQKLKNPWMTSKS